MHRRAARPDPFCPPRCTCCASFCTLRAAVARCMLRAACCALHVARCMLRAACCALHVARCMLRAACCALHVARCALRVAPCSHWPTRKWIIVTLKACVTAPFSDVNFKHVFVAGAAPLICTGINSPPPHLHRDCAQPGHICTGTARSHRPARSAAVAEE